MRRASSIRAAHLAIGPKKAGKSTSWKPSRSRSPRATSPMNRIIGVESWKATWTPAAGVGRAGTAGDEGDARAAGHLAVGVGHVGDAAFLPADDRVDLRRVVKRVEHREEALARHGEDAVAALDPELVDEDAAAGALGHGRRVSGYASVRHEVRPPLLMQLGSTAVMNSAEKSRPALSIFMVDRHLRGISMILGPRKKLRSPRGRR